MFNDIESKEKKKGASDFTLTGPGLNFFNPRTSPLLKNGWATSWNQEKKNNAIVSGDKTESFNFNIVNLHNV